MIDAWGLVASAAGRDRTKGRKAEAQIRKESGNQDVVRSPQCQCLRGSGSE